MLYYLQENVRLDEVPTKSTKCSFIYFNIKKPHKMRGSYKSKIQIITQV